MKRIKILGIVLALMMALGVASVANAAAGATNAVSGSTSLIAGYTTGPTITCNPSGFTAPSPSYTYAWYECSTSPADATAAAGGTDLSAATAAYTVPTGKTAGTYYFACVVSADDGSGNTETAFAVTSVTVSAATYTLAVNPATYTFTKAIEGYTSAPAAQTVTITNSGNSQETDITVAVPAGAKFTLGAPSKGTLAAGETATFTMQPIAGLTAGTYTCTATVTGANNAAGVTATFSFTVEAATYTLGVDKASTTFTGAPVGYTAAPAAETVTITNSGNSSETNVAVALSGTNASNFTLVNTSTAATLAAGGKTTFTVQPNTGLAAGTYTCTATVTGTHNATGVTANFSFTVAAPTYTIDIQQGGASLTSIDFGTAGSGYTQPTAQTVQVKNTGNSAVTLNTPTSSVTATNYVISSVSPKALAAGATATFTVRPKAGLKTGTYTEAITVTNVEGGSDSFTVTFVVNTANSYTLVASPSTVTFASLAKGYTSPVSLAVTINNTGNTATTINSVYSSGGTSSAFVFTPVNTPATSAGSLASPVTVAAGSSTTVVIRPVLGLTAGTYTETIYIKGANNNSTAFTVSLTVTGSGSGSGSTTTTTGTIYNSSKNIWVTGTFTSGSTLTTTRLYSGSARYDGLYKLRDGNKVLCCYDLSLSPTQTAGSVQVSFSLGTDYAGKKMTVLHTRANGAVEYLYGTVGSNGVLTVTANGLSPFMIVNGTLTAIVVSSPDTGDAPVYAVLGAALMLLAAAGVVLYIRRRA